ncbi:hypothetical protein PTSG_07622 [Salpingoeca rosetta]|uniref:K Homology domain-containing protein n=1 Tax=Salpingoeca rosetta (strain ATCC 50818 / BSB-021) TaxID=946362 RepID=F2UHA6_SALR5|nr:uncharacterized protein PTSG_07622 [Salpingoeca rosetta]EGD76505.1 hypothetical protein PTSG_07622 [Salpingoeca rosetta]|eukprot:XP_004991419.1 hypothetical protein PTSG_07622 [Salpingoeca rosetta]
MDDGNWEAVPARHTKKQKRKQRRKERAKATPDEDVRQGERTEATCGDGKSPVRRKGEQSTRHKREGGKSKSPNRIEGAPAPVQAREKGSKNKKTVGSTETAQDSAPVAHKVVDSSGQATKATVRGGKGSLGACKHVKVVAAEMQALNAVLAELDEEESLLCGTMQRFSALHAHQLHIQEDLQEDFAQLPTISQEFVRIPNRCMGVLCGRNMRKVKELSQEHDCQIVVPPRAEDPEGVALVTLVGTSAATQACSTAIDKMVQKYLSRERRRQRRHEQQQKQQEQHGSGREGGSANSGHRQLPSRRGAIYHCFIDYSNIMAGAKAATLAAQAGGHEVRDADVHIRSDHLLDLLTNSRQCGQCELIGTHIPRLVQAEATSRGFVVRSFDRHTSEVLVDDKMHAQVLQCLLQVRHSKHGRSTSPQARFTANEDAISVHSEFSQAEGANHVLTLVTGDGNDNSGNNSTSFFKCAVLALEEGWGVEVVSWQSNLSDNFVTLKHKYPSQMQLVHLDDFADSLLRHKMHI